MVRKNKQSSIVTIHQVDDSQQKLSAGSIIKTRGIYYIVLSTLDEYAKFKGLKPGDLYFSGSYSIEYNLEHIHFLRVQVIPNYDNKEKYTYDPTYHFAGNFDPQSEINKHIDVVDKAYVI